MARNVIFPGTVASQLAEFVDRYTPAIARDFKACRRRMRRLVPNGYELIHDTYNGLGVGYAAGRKSSDVVVSIVAYPRYIRLFFLNGASLNDAASILEGTANRVRSIRLQKPGDLDRHEVLDLIAQALARDGERLAACPRLTTILKSAANKRRPRRP